MKRWFSLAIATALTVAAIAPLPVSAAPLEPAPETASVSVAMSEGYGLASPTWSLAAVSAEAAPTSVPDPKLAAGLTLGTPLALGLLSIVIPSLSAGGGQFLPFFVPLGFMAGYVYAGEPGRGLVATGAGVAGLGLTYLAGVAVAFSRDLSFLSIPVFALGTALVIGGIGYDAYKTAERKAQPAVPAP